jgi:hypothetical protein
MNEHQMDYHPQAELPKPQTERDLPAAESSSSAHTEKDQSVAIEAAGTQSMPAPQQGAQNPVAPPVQLPNANQPMTAVQGQPTSSTAAMIADDVDLIEKEWVHKAKEIVERTKDDPYTQNKQMNEVRAEYLQKRYNKVVKPEDN